MRLNNEQSREIIRSWDRAVKNWKCLKADPSQPDCKILRLSGLDFPRQVAKGDYEMSHKPEIKSIEEPTHGYCAVCEGPIEKGMQWTFTKQMNRVHNDPDRCIQVLHPEHTEAFMQANPHYEWPGY